MRDNEGDVLEREHAVPLSATVDVLVAGGGPAGIAAALASAREGAKTLLIERYGYLGGMVTGAHVVWVLGVGDGYRPVARGTTQEIRERLEPLGAVRQPNKCGDYAVDPEVFKWQAAEMLAEAGADVLLHTLACDPIVEDGRVAGVFTESKNGRRAVRARVVVDCTADGDVAFRAGCGYDNETHDVSLGVRIDGIDRAKVDAFRKESPGRYEEVVAEAKRLNGGAMPDSSRRVKGVDVTDAAALTKIEVGLRRDCYRALYYLREHLPGWEEATVRLTLPQLGVRQSRRICCAYTLTDDDLRQSRQFDDGIARLGSFLLGYKLYDPAGLRYDIPYRSLVPEGIDGLLVAGRSVSSDYLANNSVRLIVPCFATGQAAGVAAALAAKGGVQPRAVPVDGLRGNLVRQGAYLGAEGQDDGETASVTDGTPLKVEDGK